MFCQHCGAENSIDVKFCTSCGKNIQSENATAKVEQATASPLPNDESKVGAVIYLMLVSVITVPIAMVIAALMFNQDNAATSTADLFKMLIFTICVGLGASTWIVHSRTASSQRLFVKYTGAGLAAAVIVLFAIAVVMNQKS